MSRPVLVLVGIPGSGTSTVAALLAAAWSEPVVEVDDLVAAELGYPEQVFATAVGERRHREATQRLGLSALQESGVVVLGGSAVESAEIREAMRGLRVVWLQASVRTVTRRLGMNALGMDALVAIRNRLEVMLAQRALLYREVATETVNTDRLPAASVAQLIDQNRGERL